MASVRGITRAGEGHLYWRPREGVIGLCIQEVVGDITPQLWASLSITLGRRLRDEATAGFMQLVLQITATNF